MTGSLTNRCISSAFFDTPTAYPAETIRLRVTLGNVKLAPSWDARTPRSFTPKRECCRRTNLGAKDFSLQRVSSESNGMDAKCYLWCIA